MNEELVLDARPVDWGHDVTLIRRNLALTPDERVRKGVAWSRRVARQVGALAEPKDLLIAGEHRAISDEPSSNEP